MIRTLPELPDGDPGRSFARLLDWHLKTGTRAGATPDKPSRRWTNEAFGRACGTNERTVRLWRDGTHVPNDLRPIERALFGTDAAYEAWRQELSAAYDTAKDVRHPAPGEDGPPAVVPGIDPPDLCFPAQWDPKLGIHVT